jgi:Cu(I)/Ag(I) efflux system periplasmic protein CusF
MKFVLAAFALLVAAPAFAQAPQSPPRATQPQGDAAATAVGSGEVKAVDAKAGAITLHHAPIAALGWPAMTMTFKAAPEVLRTAKAGQTVKFTLRISDNQIVAVEPQ